MKKNLLSVLILVLLVVNIAMTAVMMSSVVGTNKKTAELITSIATVLNLELYNPGGVAVTDVPLSETAIHDIAGTMTIPLRTTVDAEGKESKQIYIVFEFSLMMNTKHEDYATYSETIATWESVIKDSVTSVVSSHTETECRSDFESVREEILESIQDLFQSDFIYKVAITGIKFG